jgi:predicted RND superfamily exporter protein
MDYQVKIAIAATLIVVGAVWSFFRVREYARHFRETLKEDLVEFVFDAGPQIIFAVLLLVIGLSWLYFLLNHPS